MLHICANRKQLYAKIVFFMCNILEKSGIEACPLNQFLR